MEFLTLFLIYLCFVLTAIALLCICTGRKESCLARSVNGASQVKNRAFRAMIISRCGGLP